MENKRDKIKVNRPYTKESIYMDWYIPYGKSYRNEGQTILSLILNKPFELKTFIAFCKDSKLVELIGECMKNNKEAEEKLKAKQTYISSVDTMRNDMIIKGII